MPEIGIVVIGRNEGQRLANCLNRLQDFSLQTVYVDSGSTDNSVAYACSLGISIVELDKKIPFSAARARNEGFFKLIKIYPELEFVQFIDGDCEIEPEWLSTARYHLKHNPDWAIVCGRRKERYPEKSVYNMLCDLEWDTPIGQARASGGDFMIRVAAFQSVMGFNNSVIAGEEPELGFRLREIGWQIWRLDHRMTIHDADITRFPQWWKKMHRSGYSYAQGFYLHGHKRERLFMREIMRPWFWIIFIPMIIFSAAHTFSPALYTCFMIYPLQACRIMIRQYKKTGDWKQSFWFACFNLIGKLPELTGQFQFIVLRFLKRKPKIIEYK